jgi:hypothetical protein
VIFLVAIGIGTYLYFLEKDFVTASGVIEEKED